ncbi:MAG: M3 family metallopeptidase [Myxococcota bacterium]|nr:M3 family metallopeptidase [Myxococcota bacterium]
MSTENPLLSPTGLPRFSAIEPAHVEPAMRSLIAELRETLAELEAGLEPTWAGVVVPLESLGDRLGRAWGVVGHLMGVCNSDELRAAYEKVQPEVVRFALDQGQSRPVYSALKALRSGEGWSDLEEAQHRIVDSLLRDAEHSGVGLAGPERERFNAVQEELARLTTDFNNHVLDATRAWSLVLTDQTEMEGTPESLRAMCAETAREKGYPQATPEAGPWVLGLDAPCLVPFLEHAERRDLRERLYRAYLSRAGTGEFDNTPLIERILALRADEAELLGFASYAELSLSSKMAPGVDAVHELLESLRGASFDAAHADLAELQAFATRPGAGGPEKLCLWDIAYWSERLREDRFAYSEEELRPYFPLPRVLEGLFSLSQELFGVKIVAADGEAEVWHPDVRFFRVMDEAGEDLAAFFLDAYSRPGEKRGGAWMDECAGRSRRLADPGESIRKPVAYLVCNQAPPISGRPSLMSFGEVTTLFHEFGHGLQHMLTRVEEGMASGIRNVEWDAVELPSQFMENWCYQAGTLSEISGHIETGAPLPEDLFAKLAAARTFRAGSDMLRQLYFSLTDLALHHEYQPGSEGGAFAVQRQVAERNAVLPLLPEDRFLCSFGHIFGGGYAAGYYSYKWAEVLSADAFGAFEEAGLEDPQAVKAMGRRFRETVLARGGSQPPMEVFQAFRGREPKVDALLRHSGLGSA